ncbi:MAG: helix-turn-helix domain-containing protein [Prevotella sp.]|nr:helix-turn-helix domain-containing protein [Alistipes senegalensis]MCM1357035.1 helix-turn-helix domain-containing protein [Prevotella sp.]MCM1473231.1 helix-turn-helix domain-containing protein [Muribaculaceae bacterium]
MPKVTKDKEAMQKRGDILLSLRKNRNIKQSTVADILDISQQAYLKYEHGDADPTIDALIKLSQFYGVSVEYLLGIEKPMPPDIMTQLAQEFKLTELDKLLVQTYIAISPSKRTKFVESIAKIVEQKEAKQQEVSQHHDIHISQSPQPFDKVARNGKRTILSDEEVKKLHALDDDEPPNLN